MARILVFLLASLVRANADCLADAIPASERQNITLEGVSMPLGVVSSMWDSALALREIGHIVLRELMGINTVSTGAYWTISAVAFALSGCRDIHAATVAAADCAPQPGLTWPDHVSFEVWQLAAVTDVQDAYPQAALLEAREITYKGYEAMYVFPHSLQPASKDFISLTYYKSWNSTWTDASPYFSKLSDFGPDDINDCDTNSRLGEEARIARFLAGTGAEEAIVNGRFTCYNNKWVLGPGCRRTGFNPDDCVPFLTTSGWLMDPALQRMFAYNLAMAFAETTWTGYVTLPRTHRVAAYWWSPAQEFADMGARRIVWPASNNVAWNRGIFTGTYPNTDIASYVSPFVRQNYDPIFETVRSVDMLPSEIELLMASLLSYNAAGSSDAYYDAACDWVKDNIDKVKGWLPSPVKCAPGTGVRTASGGFDPETLEDAAFCQWCPPGRFSSGVRLFSGDGWSNLQTYRCEQCPRGKKIGIGGSTECESCSAGTFSAQPGQTECDLCPIGAYQSERESSSCSRCPSPMVTREEGSSVQTECLCPANYVRPCQQRSAPGGLRENCNCNLEVYHPPTNAFCVPCPSSDFLQCQVGSDEADLPCSTNQENASLNYPRPIPGYYTSFENPLEVFKCKDEVICPGNAVGTCGPNAFGLACGLCEDGHYKTVDGYCVQCGSLFQLPLVPILGALMTPVILIVMIKVGGNNDVTKGQLSVFNELLGLSYVIVIFMQTLGTNIGIMPSTPAMIEESFAWTPAISDIASQFRFSCFAKMSFEVEFALKLMAPIYGAVVFLVVFAISKVIPRIALNKDVVIGTYLGAFNAFFISVMNLSLSLFQTYRHPTGEWSMISAPAVLTNSAVWQSLVYGTAVAIVLYAAGAACGSIYAIWMASVKFKDQGFRMRWKCLFLQVRPSTYWWVIVSILKGMFLSLTTVIFDSPMAQTVWLGTGLMFYFLAVFWFLPWRTNTLLFLDIVLHYLLAVLCLLMPFFVPAADTEFENVVILFMAVTVLGVCIAAGCIFGILRTQSPNSQRAWRLTYEKDARQFVQVFQVMTDEKVIKDVLSGLADVDYAMAISVMKLLSVELLGNRESGRLVVRQQGRLGFNKKQERGPDLSEQY